MINMNPGCPQFSEISLNTRTSTWSRDPVLGDLFVCLNSSKAGKVLFFLAFQLNISATLRIYQLPLARGSTPRWHISTLPCYFLSFNVPIVTKNYIAK